MLSDSVSSHVLAWTKKKHACLCMCPFVCLQWANRLACHRMCQTYAGNESTARDTSAPKVPPLQRTRSRPLGQWFAGRGPGVSCIMIVHEPLGQWLGWQMGLGLGCPRSSALCTANEPEAPSIQRSWWQALVTSLVT